MNEYKMLLEEVLDSIKGHLLVCSCGCKSIIPTGHGKFNQTDGTLECPICGGVLYDYADSVMRVSAEFHI